MISNMTSVISNKTSKSVKGYVKESHGSVRGCDKGVSRGMTKRGCVDASFPKKILSIFTQKKMVFLGD